MNFTFTPLGTKCIFLCCTHLFGFSLRKKNLLIQNLQIWIAFTSSEIFFLCDWCCFPYNRYFKQMLELSDVKTLGDHSINRVYFDKGVGNGNYCFLKGLFQRNLKWLVLLYLGGLFEWHSLLIWNYFFTGKSVYFHSMYSLYQATCQSHI